MHILSLNFKKHFSVKIIGYRGLGHIEQSVTFLPADTCQTANPGVPSVILARLMETDHEIISTAILLAAVICLTADPGVAG